MTTQMSNYVETFRAEFEAQKDQPNGLSNYTRWLEQRMTERDRQNVQLSMAATQNFDLWKKTSTENERLNAILDHLRDWLVDNTFPSTVAFLDHLLDQGRIDG